ncbi:hypothetical protein NPX13_g9543 [Xylaria arbuscula]|uniref:Uncharacterized protein n=1 Tax=Xylaria arbuscula TaxID=114810 RepID=A0A9W8TIC2_9PEZI|nr:hypothetical protein NPX13_g9543 [Xylaria arbuscula]
MLHRGKPKDSASSKRKVTPPSPTYMNNDQFAAYLAGLRENRVNRPGGARPPPPSTRSRPDPSRLMSTRGPTLTCPNHEVAAPISPAAVTSRYSMSTTASGRDYSPDKPAAAPLRPSDVVPSAAYIERGQRWMEKEEAFSLHQAMEVIDMKDEQKEESKEEGEQDEETRLYNAALDEAAELVYCHEHGIKPREPDAPYRYRPHMRKNSYAHARTELARTSVRSFSGSSSGSDRDSSPGSARGSLDQQQRGDSMESGNPKRPALPGSGSRKSSGGRRRSSMRRNISGEIERPFSGDQIWEEPEGINAEQTSARQLPQIPMYSQPLGVKTRNPSNNNKVQFAPVSSGDQSSNPATTPLKPLSRTEIHKNPPSQSRNPNYTRNDPSESPRTSQDIPRKNGVEIRGDDIRQATSMRLSDRSSKLPTPSAVTDSPGRPIVSFDKNWKAPEEAAADPKPDEFRRVPAGITKGSPGPQNPQPPVPTIICTPDLPSTAPPATQPFRRPAAIPSIQIDSDDAPRAPAIPVINVSDEGDRPLPTIVLPGDGDDDRSSSTVPSIPVIVTPDDVPPRSSARPLPDPKSAPPSRIRNLPTAPAGGRPQGHWSPAPGASRRATATCHEP